MKTNTLLFSILFTFISITPAFATAQFGEHLEYNGSDIVMFTEPLRTYLATLKVYPKEFMQGCSACWRGYIGEWKIEDNKMFLTRLRVGTPTKKDIASEMAPQAFTVLYSSSDNIPLSAIFKNASGPVFASWFSGVIRIPQGKLLYYVHMGYQSIFESDLIILLSHGRMVGKFIIDNRMNPAERRASIISALKENATAITADKLLHEDIKRCFPYNRDPGT